MPWKKKIIYPVNCHLQSKQGSAGSECVFTLREKKKKKLNTPVQKCRLGKITDHSSASGMNVNSFWALGGASTVKNTQSKYRYLCRDRNSTTRFVRFYIQFCCVFKFIICLTHVHTCMEVSKWLSLSVMYLIRMLRGCFYIVHHVTQRV